MHAVLDERITCMKTIQECRMTCMIKRRLYYNDYLFEPEFSTFGNRI